MRLALSAHVLRYALIASVFAAPACFVDHGSELPADFSTCTAQAGSAESVSVPTDRILTYYQDAKPIIDARCAGCHVPDGIAPFALTTYDEVFRFHDSIRFAVDTGAMPPWHPDECCREYLYDRSLTPHERAVMLEWIDQGVQPGDPADEGAPLDHDTGGISRVDATISMREPFDPIARIGVDELRCFVLDWPYQEQVFVTGLNVLPGNYSIVHHVVLFVVDDGDTDDLERLDGADGRPGWDCYGELGARPTGAIGGWVPGTFGFDFPEGLGRRVKAGSKVLLQVHYDTANRTPEPDLMSIELKVDQSVEREAKAVAVANPQWLVGDSMKVEAGDPDAMYHFKIDPTVLFGDRGPIELFNANIHMHEYGSSASLAVLRADGTTECLLNVREFDFYWNGDYFFETPVIINPGDELYLECHFDNTAANQKIVNGELQSPQDLVWHADGEMCAGILMMAEVTR